MMRRSLAFGFGGAMALAVTLAAPAAQADAIRYRYVALDQVPLPAPYTFFDPITVIDGRVFGTVFDTTFTISNVAVYHDGKITIGPSGTASIANGAGIIGGANPSSQAALFQGNVTTLVPRLTGEAFASVIGLNDANLALVMSTNDAFSGSTFAYFRAGKESVINFGLPDPVFGAFLNDDGLVAVTKEESQTDQFLHGYRFDPRTGTSTLLPPFSGDPTDTEVLVQGIHGHGEVLGYSFTQDFTPGVYHERVGVWNQGAVFKPFFLETITTNLLVFNDEDEIVISNSSDGNSYLVPTPGTRLNLATLVRNLPAGLSLQQSDSIDDDGNITGIAADVNGNSFPFLLLALGQGDGDPGPVSVHGCKVPAAITQQTGKNHPNK